MALFRFIHGTVQQDNYVGYAQMFPGSIGKILFFDSRLFPGLPILIYLTNFFVRNFYFASYLITILSFSGSYFLLYKITNSKLSFLPLVFPPIMLNLASLIDTELPFIFLILLAYSLIKNKKQALAFLIIGISVWFRLAGFAVIFGVFIYFVLKKDIKKFLKMLPFFAIPVLGLFIYNSYYFGPRNIFYQLFTYEALHPGRIDIGFVQLGADLIRAFRWHWYRIFFSGLFYIIFFAVAWMKAVKLKGLEFWIITSMYIFVLAVNLVPFLENLGRYLAPAVPFFWIIFYQKFNDSKNLYLLLPLSILVVLF